YRFPRYPLPPGQNPDDYLETLCRNKVGERYRDPDREVEARLQEELDLIRRLGLTDYFLVVWDIMEFARQRGILAQGRGSAANSLVAYLLGITAVDPIRQRLFLGRFLNEEMTSMPDIDIDIASDRRDEVISYVYRKYGEEHAAMACTFVTFQGRNAVREVGKALGWPDPLLDRMAKSVTAHDARGLETDLGQLEEFKPHLSSPAGQEFLALCRQIADFPRHLSIHVGAMVISCRPLSELVPLERATLPGRVVCQWDKDGIAAAGLIKIDLLGLRMLSLISEALILAGESRGKSMSRRDIPPDDPGVFDLIARADTLGVFQVESRAQAQALPAVKPRSLADLTIQVALIRPGPLQGNMVHPYLRRRHGQEKVTFLHPCLQPILEETLGIILFQEQALQVACAIADFTPGEADGLRRAMSQKRSRAALARFRQRFLTGAAARGVSPESAEQIFQQLEAFGQYGFCKSHAAGFALLAYQSAWLKLYFPAQFYAALLNNQPMGFYPPEVIIGDARRHGVTILPVDINRSRFRCTVESGSYHQPGRVRLGLRFVKALGEVTAEVIEKERQKGLFVSLADFYRRTSPHREIVNREAIENLILAGAFDAFGSRRQLLWGLGLLSRLPPASLPLSFPEAEVPLPPLSVAGETVLEYELQGFSCRQHLLSALRPHLPALRPPALSPGGAATSPAPLCRAADLARLATGTRVRLAGCVVARQAPPTAKGHVFLTLEDETGLVDVILKPRVYQRYRQVARLEPLLLVEGTLQKREGATNLIAAHLTPLHSLSPSAPSAPPTSL
ncbi:MAG TPA: DNA polymerase III subunit alpha, partial [Firmicutes bacterium]|nr:DNA polymerase III subunit alpha [Bacillota bacterium]